MRALTLIVALCPALAFAQSEADAPIDIDFGPERIGGPGVTADDRARRHARDEPDSYVTEDNLAPEGSSKRLPQLHLIAKRYAKGAVWTDACARYDQLLEEGGDEGLTSNPEGQRLAAQSFYQCGKAAAAAAEYELAEAWLKKSERFGRSDHRQRSVRRKIQREQYKQKMLNQDVEGAMGVFVEYQKERPDEDARIWMGEELAKLAWSAYRANDEDMLERYIGYAGTVAPRNPNLRKLISERDSQANVLRNVTVAAGCALILLGFAVQLSRWRERRKVTSMLRGRRNKFIDDDDSHITV